MVLMTLVKNPKCLINIPYWQKLSQQEKNAKSRISFFLKVNLKTRSIKCRKTFKGREN